METVLRAHLPGGNFGHVSKQRSAAMRSVKGKANGTTENRLRFAIVRAGLRHWRVHPPGIAGNPDFVFPRTKLAIFTDGCFWHGCPTCYHSPIKAHSDYWTEKVNRNRARDLRLTRSLRSQGWRVIRVWEHELARSPHAVIARITRALGSDQL
jgi:DNA mismatch endonuclease (patch repair protein)